MLYSNRSSSNIFPNTSCYSLWKSSIWRNFSLSELWRKVQQQSISVDDTELGQDDTEGYLALLGSLPSQDGSTAQTIIRIERTKDLPPNEETLLKEFVSRIEVIGQNDIASQYFTSPLLLIICQYSWMKAWLIEDRPQLPDLKIDVICPATETHIRKVNVCLPLLFLCTECNIVYPSGSCHGSRNSWIIFKGCMAIHPVLWPQTNWVAIPNNEPHCVCSLWDRIRNIFDGKAEKESIIHSSPLFVLLHDQKWAPPTPNSPSLDKLYLLAISRPSMGLRSLRDLRAEHIPFLKQIKQMGVQAADNYGLIGKGRVRMFVHYQPSYCKWSRSRGLSRYKAFVLSRLLPCPYSQCKSPRFNRNERGSSTSFRRHYIDGMTSSIGIIELTQV